MTHWQMYLITRLDTILTFAGITMGVSLAIILVAFWGYYEMKADFIDKLKRAKRGDWDVPDIERTLAEIKQGITAVWVLFGSLFLIALATILGLPSEKALYKIIIVPKIFNETIKNDYRELYDLAVDALKEKLKGDGR